MTGKEAVQRFLTEQPCWIISDVQEHPERGTILSTACMEAFVAWAVANGLTTPQKAEISLAVMKNHPEAFTVQPLGNKPAERN